MVTQTATQPDITLRISVTDRCDLRCLHCLPAEGITPLAERGEVLTYEEIVRVVRAVGRIAPSVTVRLTGGEPLMRRDIVGLVAMLSALEVADLALTTNGQVLGALSRRLKEAGLMRVNVSLDTLQPERYAQLTRGGDLSQTLAGIDAALACELTPVKLNAVVLRGVNNEEVCDLVRFAAERDCQMRFIELMPIGEAASRHSEWFVPVDEVRQRLEREFDFGEQLPGPDAPARLFSVRSRDAGVSGTVGFIASMSHPFCDGCRRLRLTSRGELVGCLTHEHGLDLRRILRNGAPDAELTGAVQSALALKCAERGPFRTRSMATLGG